MARTNLEDGCPFCRYAAASDHAVDGALVAGRNIRYDRTRPVMWFEPLNPVTPGHLLFVPTWHAEHRDTVGATAAFRAAYEYATTRVDPVDFNLVLSSGHDATQTISHLHAHYVPRRPGDGLLLPWGGPR